MFRARALALVALLTAAGWACSSEDEPAVGRGDGRLVTIEARDNRFSPARVEIDAGTTVQWVNVGHRAHNVLQVGGGDFGVKTSKFGPGNRYVHRFDSPGGFAFWCSLHGSRTKGMVGRVVVVPGPPTTSTG